MEACERRSEADPLIDRDPASAQGHARQSQADPSARGAFFSEMNNGR
jgi:hypothetical protein